MAFGVLAGAVVVALRSIVPHAFTDDPAVAELAAFLLVWVAVLQPVNGVAFVLDGILIGAGDMRFLAWAMAGAAAVFIPAAVAVAVLDAGIGWLWGALGLLMATRVATLLARFTGDGWVVLGAVR
jgi:Na+-driven multidrug efflux pump